ncbi:MAG: hypothetical protein ACI9NN_001378, partial [Bacteroidia bacterium]
MDGLNLHSITKKNRMKKIVLLSFVVFGLTLTTSAQQMLESERGLIESSDAIPYKLGKRVVTDWYDFISNSADFGVTYTRITNATLFPDTLLNQLDGDGAGGVQLGRTGTHSIGQIFDPKDDVYLFDQPALSEFNPYLVDSVAFLYQYGRRIPGSVDTLVIQFYNDDKVQRTRLSSSQRNTATVDYSKTLNKGSSATSEMRYFLTDADTSNYSEGTFGVITVAVPNGGMNVPANGLCAATISFIPGYAYEDGDTIEFDWETPPKKQLNHFKAARYHDNGKTLLTSEDYSTGLMANRSSRYTSLVWNDRYIPGHAWNNYDQSYYFYFHISSPNVSVEDLGQDVKIYPNPSLNRDVVIEGTTLVGTTLTVVDITGRVVVENASLKAYNTLNLEAGTYML